MFRLFMAAILLNLPLLAEEARSGSTLQEITRDAQERLKQWDEADAQEQVVQSRYWWVGLIELAVSVAFGRTVFLGHGQVIGDKNGLTVRPAAASPVTGNSR